MAGLNAKQKRFCEEYIIDLNATAAAIRAGYSKKTASEQGYQLLQKTSVAQEIAALQAARTERTKIDQDWVVKRLAALADADIRNVATWNKNGVTLKDSNKLKWEDAFTIAEVIVKETIKDSGDDEPEIVINREKRVKQVDKKGALELLGRHLGMFNDKLKLQGDPEAPLLAQIDLTKLSEEELKLLSHKLLGK